MKPTVLVLMGGGFCFACFNEARQIFNERLLWARGTPGRLVHVSGRVEETQKLGLTFFYDYDLDVKWLDAQGQQHSGKTSFGRTFRGIGKHEQARLRYDPTAPEAFVLSWAAQGGLPRFGLALLCGLIAFRVRLGRPEGAFLLCLYAAYVAAAVIVAV